MKAPKISVTSESFSFHPVLREELLSSFPGAKFREDKSKLSKEELLEFLKDSDGAIVGLDPMDDEVLSRLPKLKMISKYGVGLNNLDLHAMESRGVQLGWTGGVNKEAVSEIAVAQMINIARNISSSRDLLRSGKWVKNGGRQLSELTIGVIGVGHIGSEVIRKLMVFGPQILACDIVSKKDFLEPFGIPQVGHEEIYKSCDIITLHVPLDESTQNMIHKETFENFRPESILINTARGGLVNELDLQEALKSGPLLGAAMDVFEEEPNTTHPLFQLPNFFPTPHISGNSNQAILNMGRSAIEHLRNFFSKDSQ